MELTVLLMMLTNLMQKKVEIAVPLKYLSSFWRTLDMPLINREIELVLTWSKICVISSMERRAIKNTRRDISPTSATFQITDTKLYVPVITLSTENDKKPLKQLKSRFKRTVKWNKYRSQMTMQPQNNNLNYLIDPTFTKVNRLFVLSFARNAEVGHRDSFSHYYASNVEMKDFNVLIDGKSFSDLPAKNEGETYKKIIEMSRCND